MPKFPPSHCQACGTALEGRGACLCCGLLVSPVPSPKKSHPAGKTPSPRDPLAKPPAKVPPAARLPITPVPAMTPAAPPTRKFVVECRNCGTDWGTMDLACPACAHPDSIPTSVPATRGAVEKPSPLGSKKPLTLSSFLSGERATEMLKRGWTNRPNLKKFLSKVDLPPLLQKWIAKTDEEWLWVILGSFIFYLFIILVTV